MIGERLTIGRTDDNDIVVQSEAVSRHHATLEQSEDGVFWIRDNESKNGVQVNGQSVQESALQNGDVVQVGNFVFRFNLGDIDAQLVEEEGGESRPKRRSKVPSKRVILYGALGLVIAVMAYISMTPQAPKEAQKGNETKEPPALEVGERGSSKVAGLEDPALTRAEQEMSKLDWSNSSLKEAEQYFRKGQREYSSKNYHRAIDAFQTALSLYRGHTLANNYLRRVIYEAETEAKRHMDMAVQYYQTLQYTRAIYHFNEVIALMAHRPGDKMVVEAEKYIALAKRASEAAEIFP